MMLELLMTRQSEEDEAERSVAVANVAARLFGSNIPADAVIDETLERASDSTLKPNLLQTEISQGIDSDPSPVLDDEALRSHPRAVWIELEIGLQDGKQLRRREPTTLAEAAKRLAAQTGRGEDRCRE
jgi:hypothetical protein